MALAVRWVGALEEIEIMCAAPEEARWDSLGVGMVGDVVSSRPKDFAVFKHWTCSGVNEGELMRRWVVWDAIIW